MIGLTTDDGNVQDEEVRRVLPVGSTGRVMIRGVTMMREYWNQKEATDAAVTHDGWFDSGDLGVLDNEGFLYINGRAKDMIIRGGENISARAIEERVYEEFGEAVAECAAVGIPHSTLGEEVALAIHLKKGKSLEEVVAKLRPALSKTLAAFQLPVGVSWSGRDGWIDRWIIRG